MYTIVASVCQHPLRQSSRLPWSGSTFDFDVQYCPSCEASRSTRNERRNAEREYERSRTLYDSGSMSRSTYKESRHRYDRSRLADIEDREYWQERDDRERRSQGRPTLREESRRFAGLDDPDYLNLRREVNGYGRTARIDDSGSYRRESEYRDQPSYRRSSRAYEPGRYADRSSRGYYNTSNPPKRRGSDDDLDELSDRQLDSRRREVERALRRFR